MSFLIFLFLVVAFSFLPREIPLSICYKAGFVVLNSLSFCLSVKLLISPSNVNEILLGRAVLVGGFSCVLFFSSVSNLFIIEPENFNTHQPTTMAWWEVFCFISLSISCHYLLSCRVSAEKSADNLLAFPCMLFFLFFKN